MTETEHPLHWEASIMSSDAVSTEMVKAVGSQLAGLDLSSQAVKDHAASLEILVNQIALLRSLPIKETSPPLIFVPEVDRLDRSGRLGASGVFRRSGRLRGSAMSNERIGVGKNRSGSL